LQNPAKQLEVLGQPYVELTFSLKVLKEPSPPTAFGAVWEVRTPTRKDPAAKKTARCDNAAATNKKGCPEAGKEAANETEPDKPFPGFKESVRPDDFMGNHYDTAAIPTVVSRRHGAAIHPG
jgi:hypothetical protein